MKRNIRAFTLLELMIAIAVSSFLLAVILSLFFKEHALLSGETLRQQTATQTRLAYNILSRLIRQSESSTLRVRYAEKALFNPPHEPTVEYDGLRVDLTLPAGYPIWPNDTPPYTNTAVRLSWSNDVGANQYLIRYAVAPNQAALDDSPLIPLIGDTGARSPKVINFDVWPLRRDGATPADEASDSADGGYFMRLTLRSGIADSTYNNPDFSDQSPLRHYFVYTAASAITPRN